MATSKIAVSEGSGKNLATNSFTEDEVTKELSRVVLNSSDGSEITPQTDALTDTELRASAVPVDGSGVTQPISGTVTETNSATIAGDTTSIDGKITACNTGDVTIGSALPAGSNNIGDVDIASALPAGSNLIGKTTINDGSNDQEVSVENESAKTKGVQTMGRYDSTIPTGVDDGDSTLILTDQYGRQRVLINDIQTISGDNVIDDTLDAIQVAEQDKDATTDTNWFQATITSADATTATQVKAKTADKKIHIVSLIISTDTAMNIQLQSDNGTPQVVMEQIYLAANGGLALTFPERFPLQVNTNEDLDVIASVAGNISVTIVGYVK